MRFLPASILDITAPDDQIDGIVCRITEICSTAPVDLNPQSRVFVTPVDEWHTVRPWPRRIA